MKSSIPLFFALLLPGLGVAAPMKDRISSEELTERRLASESELNVLEKNVSEARVIRAGEQSIIAQSVILSDGSNWTLVPKGAILFLPESQNSKINTRPVGNLVPWKEFLRLNHAWVSAEEVTLRQAEGVQPLDERRVEFWSKNQKVIVATYLGGPISHIAPKTEAAQEIQAS